MENPTPIKKKPDFATDQFLRAVKHWTDSFVSGEVKLGIFLNSIQDDAHTYCRNKNRMDEWEEFIQDFVGGSESEESADVIDVDSE